MYLEIYSELPQHLLPMAETPAMQRLKHVGMHCPKEKLKHIFDDLFIGKNEDGEDELCFAHAAQADAFTRLALRQSEWFVSDDDRFSMQALADILRKAQQRGVLTVDDLYLDEPHVISLLLSDPVIAAHWQEYRCIVGTQSGPNPPEDVYAVRIAAKSAASIRWYKQKTGCGASQPSAPTTQQDYVLSAQMISTAGSGQDLNKEKPVQPLLAAPVF